MPETKDDEVARLQAEVARNPEGRLFVHLAEAYRKSGELNRARELLTEGIQQHQDYVSARIVLAQVEEELGDDRRAREAWREVMELDEENETALRALGELEYEHGQADAALRYFHRLAELGVEDPEIQRRIDELHRAVQRSGNDANANDNPGAMEANAPAEAQPQRERKDERARSSEGGEVERAVVTESRPVPSPAAAAPVAQREEGAALPAYTDAVGLSDLLVRLLEYGDGTFRAGSSLTRVLALAIGEELELEQVHLDALALAALLSDIGGLSMRDASPSPQGRRSPEAHVREQEQREVAISLQLLQGIALPAGVHEAIRHQHERWDGSGYPDGLRDEEIPYTARVIAVARACAQRLAVSGREGTAGVNAVVDDLQREAGSRFDPVIVSVLRRVFQRRADHRIGFGLGGRVVIVHPEELRSLGLATQLHSNGYVAEMAPDTGHARTRLRVQATEALVLGAYIPGSDVARFIREVRSNPAWATIPVVVIDANDMDLRVELLTAGADVCFPSEVNYREFKATLDALLRRREESGGGLA